MAKRRIYREDIRCPHCGGNWCVKNGKANGKQTYLCRDCNRRFTPEAKRHVYPERIKKKAIEMYLEGMNISSISRILGVKLGTVFSWIKKSKVSTESI